MRPCKAHSLAAALVEFLASLPYPVLPVETYPSVSKHSLGIIGDIRTENSIIEIIGILLLTMLTT